MIFLQGFLWFLTAILAVFLLIYCFPVVVTVLFVMLEVVMMVLLAPFALIFEVLKLIFGDFGGRN